MKEERSSFPWISLLIGCGFLCWGFASCILEPLSRDGHPCTDEGKCLEGWVCYLNKCVKPDKIPKDGPAGDGGKPDQVQTDKVTPEKPQERTPPPDRRDEPGPPDVVKPDEPAGPVCEPTNITQQQATCEGDDANFNQVCFKTSATFTTSAKELPQALAGAAATTNRGDGGTPLRDNIKVYIYVLGGDSGGNPSNKVYVSEISGPGKLGDWTETTSLKAARSDAFAFYIRDYVYVAGGNSGGGVGGFERAKVKADGTLEDFEALSTTADLRKDISITYLHGHFYLAGGGAKTVERIPLLPDGKLGPPEKVAELPEAFPGKLIQNHYFLYYVGTQGTNKTFFGRVNADGSFTGWCENSSLPKDIKATDALLDGRVMILHGISKANGTLNNLLYLAGLETRLSLQSGGKIKTWVCSNISEAKAVLTTPRKRAAAVVTRGHIYLIGGATGSGSELKTVEFLNLPHQEAGCDIDADSIPNAADNCPNANNKLQFNICGLDMGVVPAGAFQRGDDSADAPSKQITLDTFRIDFNEVTNAQYAACVADSKCDPPSKKAVGSISDYYDNPKYKDHPVVNVTWRMAQKYCQYVNKRLPSEAEWEKAARGLGKNLYPWGDGSADCSKANVGSCTDPEPKAVGSHPGGVSPYGMHDMSGNVREWVQDYFEKDYFSSSETNNPKGPTKGTNRTVKSSSFSAKKPDSDHKISSREGLDPQSSAEDLGFRCAQSVYLTTP